MVWLRTLFYLSPLAMVFGAVTLYWQMERLKLPGIGDALTTSIREGVGPLNPVVPQTGITREVRDLVFDPLLIRDDDLRLRPNILKSWQEQTVVTIRCSSEEAAGETEAKLRSEEYLEDDWKLLAIDRVESVLSVAIAGFEGGLEEALIRKIEPHNLGDYLLVELRLKHSVRNSLSTFLADSVEKGQIRMIDYKGDRTAYLFVKGETDLFLRELELYYESNLVLEPEIEVIGSRCHTGTHELLLELRQDVRWHDGTPVTMRDVLFSYEELTGSGSPLPLADAFRFIESIDLTDDFRMRVTCQETPAVMMESWEKLPLLPAHLLKGRAGSVPREEFFRFPVGTGPYRVIRRLEDGGIVLERNRDYAFGLPRQNRLVYRTFDSLESKLLALRSGVIDTLVPDVRFQDWAQRNPGTVRQIRCLPRFQHFVAWNLTSERLADPEMRLALAEAVNLEEIHRDSAVHFEQPVRSLFFPGSSFVSGAMPLPLHDPKSAERRLDSLDLRFDAERGTRVDKDGEVVGFRLAVNEAGEEQIRMAEALSAQWLGVGVVVEVERLSWEEILTRRLLQRDFDGVLLSWEIPTGRDRYATWHSEAIAQGGGNLFGLRNQLVDELLETIRFEREEDGLAAAASELQELIAELQPCLFICESGRVLWIREGAVETARPVPGGDYRVSGPGIGKAGLERVRPWWTRRDPDWRKEREEPES